MTIRAWEGVICVEGTQTGDGRLLVEGALEWADPPLSLAWLQDQQHSDVHAGGTQVGTIDTIERVGDEIRATGGIDDEIPEGAEVIRRMEAGTAPHGSEFYVSIDPDNYEVEIVSTNAEEGEDETILVASGTGRPPVLRGAAGDGDPEDATVLMEQASDDIIERYTRMRIRGATLLAAPALDRAVIRLSAAAADTETEETEETPAEEPSTEEEDTPEAQAASVTPITAAGVVTRPPAEWFEDPELDGPTPLTITEDGRVFGHIALWDTCHIGDESTCVVPPRSGADYAYFRTGEVQPEDCDCEAIPTGVYTLGTGHADLTMSAQDTVAHYDHTGTGAADLAAGEDQFGIWVAGALRPGVTDEQVRALRASAPSGDWRRIGGQLELVAVLAVNVPGYPVPRTRVASGTQVSLVAGGGKPLAQRSDPVQAQIAALEERLARAERVTEPLRRTAARALAASVSPSE
jgi:hypothetical protein